MAKVSPKGKVKVKGPEAAASRKEENCGRQIIFKNN